MRVFILWILPLITPSILTIVGRQQNLTDAGRFFGVLLVALVIFALWQWNFSRLMQSTAKTFRRDSILPRSQIVNYENRQYAMFPVDEKEQEENNNLHRSIKRVQREVE